MSVEERAQEDRVADVIDTLQGWLDDTPRYDGDDPRANHYRHRVGVLETAIAAIADRAGQDAVVEGWQDISTAPTGEIIDIWIEAHGPEDGWRVTGLIVMDIEPYCIEREDGGFYHPHENGGWPTHWQPLPAPPALSPTPCMIEETGNAG